MSSSCISIEITKIEHPFGFNTTREDDAVVIYANKANKSIILSIDREKGDFSYAADRTGPSFGFSTSLVCSIGKDEDGREVFMVMEGVFLVEDGKTFRVIKDNGYRISE